MYIFPPQFLFRLGSTEKICGKFCTAHVVKYLLTFLETFFLVNILRSKTSVQSHISIILKNGIVARLDDSSCPGSVRKLRVVFVQFVAQKQTTFFFCCKALIFAHLLNFRISGLNREICLRLSYFGLLGISVLGNEITGVSCEANIINRFFCDARPYNFADISKIA